MHASQSSVVEKRVPVDELVALIEENLSSFRVPDSGYGNERGQQIFNASTRVFAAIFNEW